MFIVMPLRDHDDDERGAFGGGGKGASLLLTTVEARVRMAAEKWPKAHPKNANKFAYMDI